MTAREEHWADAGRKKKPNVVGCLPGRGGGLILTRTTTKTPMAMTAMKTTTSFLDTTTNLWSDAFLAEGDDFDDDDNVNTMAGERVYSDEDDDKDPNGNDNITQTAYW